MSKNVVSDSEIVTMETQASVQSSESGSERKVVVTGHVHSYSDRLEKNSSDGGGDPIVEQESEASALPQLPTRRDGGLETPTPQPVHLPGHVQSFKGTTVQEPSSSSLLISGTTPLPLPIAQCHSIQEKLNQNADKAGLCVLCSCTNPTSATEPIMRKCFKNNLGYLKIEVGPNMSSDNLKILLQELSELKIPKSCSKTFRFLFYFFGHGNAEKICLADGDVRHEYIITEIQNMCPSRENFFKIILYDSCRSDPYAVNTEAIQQKGDIRDLSGKEQKWEHKIGYPNGKCVNTLVIHATDYYCKAYYVDGKSKLHVDDEMRGCGVVTYFFTQLVSSMNEPLTVVLAEVRKRVNKYI